MYTARNYKSKKELVTAFASGKIIGVFQSGEHTSCGIISRGGTKGMKITLELLRSKGACSEGMKWVKDNLPEGAEYQDFLDALAAADKPDWAFWLLANFDSWRGFGAS